MLRMEMNKMYILYVWNGAKFERPPPLFFHLFKRERVCAWVIDLGIPDTLLDGMGAYSYTIY